MPYADRDQQRKAQREWIARRRAEFFADKVCEWCGSALALELHHRDPSKKESHSIWSWSAIRRAAEIAKCLVLCEDCHKRAHAEARRVEAELRNPHGTYLRYKMGCHCAACRAANRDYQRARKAVA
jgi:hypothetical protein